ncbi:MAG: hypothetical protein QOC55_660 [Thermoleophilaceae bacterium]|jgi:hypothetical protein|nr:hypothetical protein [Thermoleophilaceae bacterium]
MLFSPLLDGLARLLRIASVVAVAFVLAGLIGFLTDEVRDTSTAQATRIPDPGNGRVVTMTVDLTQPDPAPGVERAREAEHTRAREFIDDAGDMLMSPFTSIIPGSAPWVRRLLYSALALFAYGFVLQVLADFIRRRSGGWRRGALVARERAAAEERRRTGTYASPA